MYELLWKQLWLVVKLPLMSVPLCTISKWLANGNESFSSLVKAISHYTSLSDPCHHAHLRHVLLSIPDSRPFVWGYRWVGRGGWEGHRILLAGGPFMLSNSQAFLGFVWRWLVLLKSPEVGVRVGFGNDQSWIVSYLLPAPPPY